MGVPQNDQEMAGNTTHRAQPFTDAVDIEGKVPFEICSTQLAVFWCRFGMENIWVGKLLVQSSGKIQRGPWLRSEMDQLAGDRYAEMISTGYLPHKVWLI